VQQFIHRTAGYHC